jgi:hypothetical protein
MVMSSSAHARLSAHTLPVDGMPQDRAGDATVENCCRRATTHEIATTVSPENSGC